MAQNEFEQVHTPLVRSAKCQLDGVAKWECKEEVKW